MVRSFLLTLSLLLTGNSFIAAYAQNPAIMYVAKNGSDSNSGLSLQAPKLTVAAAVSQLPHLGTLGSGGAHYGQINIGPGLFVEQGGLELNQTISYVGTQSGFLDATGTTIQLASHASRSLFSYTPDWISAADSRADPTAYSHYVSLKYLNLDGNSQNNSETSTQLDLVDLSGGGYNTYIQDVTFQNAPRYGLYLDEKQVNFSCYTCTFSNNLGGAVYANDTGSGTVVTFIDTQLDNNGNDAITITTGDQNYANGGSYVFINLKGEATSAGNHVHLIRHNPAPDNLTYPPAITVIGAHAYSVASADSLFYESTGNGTEARWNVQNAYAQMGYANGVFHSAKSGVNSQGVSASHFISNDPSSAALGRPGMVAPDLQLSSGVTLSGGGNPSGVISANPGSLYLDHTDGRLWIKHSGSGNSGWVQVGP